MEVAHPQRSSSSTVIIPGRIGIWKCWFLRRGGNWITQKKTSQDKGVNGNNELNPHMASTLGFDPGPHWWEASALTTAPSLAPKLRGNISMGKKVFLMGEGSF